MLNKVLKVSELDLNFKFEIAKTREGRTVLWCVQCGMCSSGCPFSEALNVKPHEIVKMILLGMRDEALTCKNIWVCATCYICAERCPQGVELGDILVALANIAARERGVPEGLSDIGKLLLEDGRAIKVSRIRMKERERMELPPIPNPNVFQTRKILKETGLDEVINKER